MKKIFLFLCLFLFQTAFSANFLICRLAPGADAKQIAVDYGLTLIDTTDPAPFVYYQVPDGVDPDLIQQDMLDDPRIIWAEEDQTVIMPEHIGAGKGTTIGVVGDSKTFYEENKNVLQQIEYVPPSFLSSYNRRVRVAILDTGISPYQPILLFRVVAKLNVVEPNEQPWDLPKNTDSDGDGEKDEGVGHGTMVAGIVAMLSPTTQLVVVRVADSDGYSTAWRIIKGLAFAVINGAEVANVSLGSEQQVKALSDVLDWTDENGLVICAPVGNGNHEGADFPARYSESICVTGVDPYDIKASFSNWDGTAESAAPATGIVSFWWDGTMGIWSGTSFGSPFVVGALAAGLSHIKPVLIPDVIRDIVNESGDNIDGLNPNYEQKLGTRLNMRSLMLALKSAGG
ncbi:MAG TPA: S8 family serine peptidase [Fimbriimonadales bacterium]|nr:S8 family serine peptidase [Fimbriimonadales bacterium]